MTVPWGSKAILNDIFNSASQPGNCLLSSAVTNPFYAGAAPVLGRDGLYASEAGTWALRMKIPQEFDGDFAQSSRPNKELPPRRADSHVSGLLGDVNAAVVSRYP